MNRRQLLKYLAGGVVSVATGEVLVPAARTYFLPPRGGWPVENYSIVFLRPVFEEIRFTITIDPFEAVDKLPRFPRQFVPSLASA